MLPGIRAYEQLGFRAFGTPGKMAAGIAITLQNIGGEKSLMLCVACKFCAVHLGFLYFLMRIMYIYGLHKATFELSFTLAFTC